MIRIDDTLGIATQHSSGLRRRPTHPRSTAGASGLGNRSGAGVARQSRQGARLTVPAIYLAFLFTASTVGSFCVCGWLEVVMGRYPWPVRAVLSAGLIVWFMATIGGSLIAGEIVKRGAL